MASFPPYPGEGSQHAQEARPAGEDEAFGEQLPDQPPSAGPEGGPHGHLGLTFRHASEHERGDVGTDNHQQAEASAEPHRDLNVGALPDSTIEHLVAHDQRIVRRPG
jgi:hypothetical protein